jgi:3-hydroxyisobutyrate dehydrogenase-like beta-hydroxyacid dehydrogenase
MNIRSIMHLRIYIYKHFLIGFQGFMNKKIGFIGVGMMGHGIAKNLLEKGFPVTAMAHRNRAPLEDLLEKGAQEAATPKAIAENSDIIILCVTGSPQVEQCMDGSDGIIANCRSGSIVIDCSTAEPTSTDRIANDLKAKGVTLVDAPLARTPVEAEEGRLNTMVGADDDVFAEVKPILAAFCENIFHVGGPGAGHKVKLVYNFLAMSQAAMIAEALCACGATDVDPRKIYEVVSVGGVNSPIFQMIVSNALEGDYSGLKFSLGNGEKDLRYYNRMAEAAGLTNSLGRNLHHTFVQGLKLGFEDSYVGSLIEAQAKLNNVNIIDK